MDEHLKDCAYIKSLVDDLVVAYDKIEDNPESASINPSKGISYWLIAVVLLAKACLH